MRRFLNLLPGLVIIILAAPAHSGDETKPREIIDRALKAGGGAEKISKFKAVSFKGEASGKALSGKSEKIKFSAVFAAHDLFRMDIQMTENETFTMVGGGDTFWSKQGAEEAIEYSGGNDSGKFDSAIRLFYALSLPDRLLMLKSKEYKLAFVGDQGVNGVQAVAVRVNHERHPEVMLYFDKETGLPIKSQVKLPPPKDDIGFSFGNKKAESVELFFDEYKVFDGVKHFTKVKLRAGDEIMEFVLQEITLHRKHDAGHFKKPK